MRLIVGLGNPGKRYRDSPHNAGFQVCDRFAQRNGLGEPTTKFQGLFYRGRIKGQDVGVLEPQTYMNLSGDSVAEALRYLPVETEDLVVVWDEMDLPSGKLRLRKGGGHNGHNGVRSIIERIGSRDFPRLRVGVGRPKHPGGATPHLLSKVAEEKRERFSETIDRAVEALEMIIDQGFEPAMNRYNGMPAVGEQEEGKS